MTRYAKTLWRFWSTAIAAELEYRVNFISALITSCVGVIGGLFTLSLFYQGGARLGGWSWEEALLVMGLYTATQGFSTMVLGPNLNRLVGHVQTGTLDFVLLKPIDSQFWISLRALSPWGAPDVLNGLGLLVYAGVRLHLSPGNLLLALLPLLTAAIVLYSLWFMLATTSIWFVRVGNATFVLQSLLEAGRYPLSAYPSPLRVVFVAVIPVAFITTVPVQTLLGHTSWPWLGWAAILALSLFLLARLFWRWAQRHYTSASS